MSLDLQSLHDWSSRLTTRPEQRVTSPKLSIGCQIWTQSRSDWSQIGQIWGFIQIRSKCAGTDLKKNHISFIWGQSDPIWMPNLTSHAKTELNVCLIDYLVIVCQTAEYLYAFQSFPYNKFAVFFFNIRCMGFQHSSHLLQQNIWK